MKTTLKAAVAGAIITLLGIATYEAVLHVSKTPPASSAAHSPAIQPFAVDPKWVLEGQPNFRATEFFKSSDGKTSSGIFECDASRFEWHYQFDEAVYILEGDVDIDYLGKRFTLQAGDSAFFRAGTVAVWQVRRHVKKTWTIYDAGKPARGLAKVLQK